MYRDPFYTEFNAVITEGEPTHDSEPVAVPVYHSSGIPGVSQKRHLNEAEGQVADYAAEAMRSGLFRYFTSVLIQDDLISLWYFDRMGAIRSRCFRAREDPHLFLLLTVAIARASLKNFGFESMIAPAEGSTVPRPVGPHEWTKPQDELHEQDLFTRLRELYRTSSSYEAPLLDWKDNVLRLEHDLDAAEGWPFEPESGLSSTDVTSLLSKDDTSSSPAEDACSRAANDTSSSSPPRTSLPISFPITGPPIYAQPGGVGRGTVVYPLASPKDVNGYDPTEALVAKFSWQPPKRAAEAQILRYIRKKIPDHWRMHVTDVKCSKKVAMKATDIPRVELMMDTDERVKKRAETPKFHKQEYEEVRDAFIGSRIEDRDFHALVSTQYMPLKDVKDANEFMAVFIDVVKGVSRCFVFLSCL